MHETTFIKAIRKRKSRKSTRNYSTVDFEYIGNTSQYQHLIGKRAVGMPNYS